MHVRERLFSADNKTSFMKFKQIFLIISVSGSVMFNIHVIDAKSFTSVKVTAPILFINV